VNEKNKKVPLALRQALVVSRDCMQLPISVTGEWPLARLTVEHFKLLDSLIQRGIFRGKPMFEATAYE
jgi:hypothetical protein